MFPPAELNHLLQSGPAFPIAPTVAHWASWYFLSKQEDVMWGCECCGQVSCVLALQGSGARDGSITMDFLAKFFLFSLVLLWRKLAVKPRFLEAAESLKSLERYVVISESWSPCQLVYNMHCTANRASKVWEVNMLIWSRVVFLVIDFITQTHHEPFCWHVSRQ